MSWDEDSNNHWNYDNPSEWSKDFPCANGLCQSPIDINPLNTISQMYPPYLFSSQYNSDKLFTLINTGQQIIATLSNCSNEQQPHDVWFSGSGLPGIFHLINFHLHWGRNDRHGSEHEIDGHRYPAEAHVVHKNYDNGQIVILAFFFTVTDNDDEHNEWEKYAEIASRLRNIHDTIDCTFNLSKLIQIDDSDFYRYTGSLTTPPCTEGILWTIFNHRISIKEKSLNLLRQYVMTKAYRPVQPINGRTIFRNDSHSKMT